MQEGMVGKRAQRRNVPSGMTAGQWLIMHFVGHDRNFGLTLNTCIILYSFTSYALPLLIICLS